MAPLLNVSQFVLLYAERDEFLLGDELKICSTSQVLEMDLIPPNFAPVVLMTYELVD